MKFIYLCMLVVAPLYSSYPIQPPKDNPKIINQRKGNAHDVVSSIALNMVCDGNLCGVTTIKNITFDCYTVVIPGVYRILRNGFDSNDIVEFDHHVFLRLTSYKICDVYELGVDGLIYFSGRIYLS